MGTELKLDIGTLYAFLLVLARVSGVFIFVPLPGIKAGPEVARVVALALSITFVLFPRWPVIDPRTEFRLADRMDAGRSRAWESRVGLAVAFLTEGFQMGAQIISLQAGYTFRDHDRSDLRRRFQRPAHDRADSPPGCCSSPPAWIARFCWLSRRASRVASARAISRSQPSMVNRLIADGIVMFTHRPAPGAAAAGAAADGGNFAGLAGAAEFATAAHHAGVSHQDAGVAGAAGMAGPGLSARCSRSPSGPVLRLIRASARRLRSHVMADSQAKQKNPHGGGSKRPARKAISPPRANWWPPASSWSSSSSCFAWFPGWLSGMKAMLRPSLTRAFHADLDVTTLPGIALGAAPAGVRSALRHRRAYRLLTR